MEEVDQKMGDFCGSFFLHQMTKPNQDQKLA